MRAVVRSAWSRCVCNLHLLMQAAAIQGAMLQRLTVVPLRLNHDLALEIKDLLGILGYQKLFFQNVLRFWHYSDKDPKMHLAPA